MEVFARGIFDCGSTTRWRGRGGCNFHPRGLSATRVLLATYRRYWHDAKSDAEVEEDSNVANISPEKKSRFFSLFLFSVFSLSFFSSSPCRGGTSAKRRACVPLSVALDRDHVRCCVACFVARRGGVRCLLACLLASLSVPSDRSRVIFRTCFATCN